MLLMTASKKRYANMRRLTNEAEDKNLIVWWSLTIIKDLKAGKVLALAQA